MASDVAYPRGALPTSFAHHPGESIVPGSGHVLGEPEDGGLDIGEVLVEGRRRRPRLPGDVHHLQIPVIGVRQHRERARREPVTGGATAATRHPTIDRAQRLVVVRFVDRIDVRHRRVVRHAQPLVGAIQRSPYWPMRSTACSRDVGAITPFAIHAEVSSVVTPARSSRSIVSSVGIASGDATIS